MGDLFDYNPFGSLTTGVTITIPFDTLGGWTFEYKWEETDKASEMPWTPAPVTTPQVYPAPLAPARTPTRTFPLRRRRPVDRPKAA